VKGLILSRLNRVECGNLGDCKSVGSGVFELRFDLGPGYRVFFCHKNKMIYILGGSIKKSQKNAIKKAVKLKGEILKWKKTN